MTKTLHEIVRETQNAQTQFEENALWKLNDMQENPDPATFESDATMLKLYSHTIRGMGENTDALIALSRESAQ